MIKSQRDFWAGLLFAALGIATAASTAQRMDALPAPAVHGTGTLVLGAVLALLGVVVLFKSLTIETEGGEPVRGRGGSALLAVAGAATVYAAVATTLGWWWAVPAAALAACTAIGGRVWPIGLGVWSASWLVAGAAVAFGWTVPPAATPAAPPAAPATTAAPRH